MGFEEQIEQEKRMTDTERLAQLDQLILTVLDQMDRYSTKIDLEEIGERIQPGQDNTLSIEEMKWINKKANYTNILFIFDKENDEIIGVDPLSTEPFFPHVETEINKHKVKNSHTTMEKCDCPQALQWQMRKRFLNSLIDEKEKIIKEHYMDTETKIEDVSSQVEKK